MPITDLVIIAGTILFFAAFAVVLAWGDFQTREIARESRWRALNGAQGMPLKEGAEAESARRPTSESGRAAAHSS
jgi:hypothetical protein